MMILLINDNALILSGYYMNIQRQPLTFPGIEVFLNRGTA